jgi:protein STU2
MYRTRSLTITPIVEKGLAATRPAAKQKALEALLLYIELDKPDPVVDELLPILSHKQPKIIAATLSALTAIYHAYGCKTVEPKPTLKMLPKVFGHADKNVRAEAQNLTVELYRWLKDAMKPLFWNDLKQVQQGDLEKLFEKVKDEPPPKQERLLRSQQAVEASVPSGGGDVGNGEVFEEEGEIDLEPEYEAVNILSKVPKDLQERLSSTKWKDRKEALDDLHQVINVPKIEEGQFDDILRALAKCMKDANIAVVTIAASCIELLAKGLKRGFSRYRSTVMDPMMERLKEKKQSVTDAIGAALDAVFSSTSLSDIMEGVLEFLKHKNPQVKLESTRFLIRCLKNTRDPPAPPELKSIADAATKLLTESQEVQRSAGAEVLGTLWKIMGDRAMGPFLNDLDEIRKTKIKEYYESAEVKAKNKPKPAPAPKAAPVAQKRMGMAGKKPHGISTPGIKKPAPAPPVEEPTPAALTPRLTSRPVSKLGPPKSGLAAPSGLRGPGGLQKKIPGPSALASPARKVVSPVEETSPPPPPKVGLGPNRGLAGRPLARPAPVESQAPITASGLSGLSTAERGELEELRAENERMRRETEILRADKALLTGKLAEVTNHNSELIEDHDRQVLSLKAKEKAKERHVEALEQQVQTQQKETERLKRELSRQVRASSPAPLDLLADGGPGSAMAGIRSSRGYVTSPSAKSAGSSGSGGFGNQEGKENFAPSE